MACFQQVESFQTLLKEDFKSLETASPNDLVHRKCVLQIKIFGADELLSIVCPSLIVIENIAQLVDGYCKLQLKKVDSLWINKCKLEIDQFGFKFCLSILSLSLSSSTDNNFSPKEIPQPNTQVTKSKPAYDNEEKDYAEIMEEEDDYSVPNCKINKIDRSQVKIINLIGVGQFGEVYRGIYTNEPGQEIEVAVKTCKSENGLSEAYTMLEFEHNHIIQLIGICPSSPVLILMELAKFGQLRQYLQSNRETIDLSTLVLYSYQLSTALSYLESKNFVHRDIAARNVLVTDHRTVKLADFGLSRLIQDYYKATNCKLPIKWMAPESINFRKFTKSSDVWSFAVLVWEIFSFGVKPFEGIKNSLVINKIENGDRPPLPEICPPSLYNLLLHCWRYEPTERPNVKQVESFLCDLLNSLSCDEKSETKSETKSEEIFDEEFKKSLMEIKLKSQQKQSIEDAQWLENEEKEMFGSCQFGNTSLQFSSSENQSLKSETASISSNNPFLDSRK